MSTPLTPPSELRQSAPRCPNCEAPLAAHQRYCLSCGQRLAEPRVDFQHALGLAPEPPVIAPRPGLWDQRGTLITFAGIAAIVVALGVGIVIGRGNGGTPVAKQTVITVTSAALPTAAAPATAATAPVEATTVTETWPASASGWTVELSTLPTTAQAWDVTAAESAATSKGATAVGVLKGGGHRGTPTGTYVIYSGRYSTQKQADAAKAKLKKSFPNAIVLHVTPSTTAGSGSSGNASAQLNNLSKLSGSAASKASAKLPSTLSSGGTAPATDHKAPGGGSSGTCIGAC